MAIRYCSFATRGYRWRQWMRMTSLKLAEPSVELSFWNLGRLLSAGIRREVPWFDPHLHGAGYWCWKPFIMLRELESLQEGDYLLYTAGNAFPPFSTASCPMAGGEGAGYPAGSEYLLLHGRFVKMVQAERF